MRNLLTEVSKMKNIMGLTEADKPKYSPEVKSLVAVLKDNKVYSAQIQKFINKIEEYSKDGLVDFGLLTRGILKTLKLKGNKDINVFEFFKQLTKSLEKRKTKKEVVTPEEEPSILDKDIYKKELFFLQVELLKLQEWLKQTGKTVIIVFEGRDSAGKGSTIKKFTENLNPRYYKVIALGIPTPEERKNWWDRYSNQIERGKINFFDRSWYNRGLVEPVMGYGSSEEYEDFMDNVQDFEESLVVDGDYLFKLWFSIDKETQAKRFDFRQKSPLKYWKYSENDEKMQDVWEKFTEYKQKLFDKTSTVNHPWVVLDSNDKKISGLNSIRYVLQNIPYTNKDEDVLNKDFPEAMTVLKPNINEETNPFDYFNNYFKNTDKNKDMKELGTTWENLSKIIGTNNKPEGTLSDDLKKIMDKIKTSGVTDNDKSDNSFIDSIKKVLKTASEKITNKVESTTGGYATKCSTKSIDYIKKQEGFEKKAYQDPKGIWTIGYGQINIDGRPVRNGDRITEPEAAKKVVDYIQNVIEPEILSYGGGHNKLTQNQFDALCSLKYNFGGYSKSDLRQAIQIDPNPNRNPNIRKHFTTGWKDGILKRRRNKEFDLYAKGDYVPYNQNIT